MTATTATPAGYMMLKNVRLAFAQNLTEPGTVEGAGPDAKPNYNCGILLPPDHPQVKEIERVMQQVAKGQWKDKAPGIYSTLQKTDKLALHDGDNKAYEGYPGNLYLNPNAKENTPPTWLGGADGRTPLNAKEAARLFYSGCYVNVAIEIWAQDNKFGKRINAGLRGIQFLRHGDAFSGGGKPASADEFEPIDNGADAGDFGMAPWGADDELA